MGDSFKVINWSPNDTITDYKLDAMVSNDNFLRANRTKGLYRAHGVRRAEGLKIVAGCQMIAAKNQPQSNTTVTFGGQLWSSGCKPLVTASIISKQQRKVWLTIDGIGTKLHPSSAGFQIHVVVDAAKKADQKIKRNMYVSWHALGF